MELRGRRKSENKKLKGGEYREREEEWDRRMDIWWNGLMVWVKLSMDEAWAMAQPILEAYQPEPPPA